MSVRVAERRAAARAAAALPAVVCDRRGRVLARGCTANISECGVMVIIRWEGDFDGSPVIVELTVPAAKAPGPLHVRRKGRRLSPRRNATRQVRYLCRVARLTRLGPMLGLGLEFTRKLG
jgi:hypothetical protein